MLTRILRRCMAAPAKPAAASGSTGAYDVSRVRNVGISAHIDSGKTTLTERILYYAGRIHSIHDVRGRDGVGATMDHMELEKERGITIQSAATRVEWRDSQINIIDTPGHVDFTVEVERALRVLDGAVLVLCAVSGVQSQTITVDRQMRRYNVPRVVFINKLDRTGSNPQRVVHQLRDKLRLNAAATQVPIGLEALHEGVVDVVNWRTVRFGGERGETVEVEDGVPDSMKDECEAARQELVEAVAEVDDELAERALFGDDPVTADELQKAMRRSVLARTFVPVFMGSAFKNKGVQPCLDAMVDLLPQPNEVPIVALDASKAAIEAGEQPEVSLKSDTEAPFVGLAFKLEDGRFGQLTYMRIYQGTLRRGDTIYDVAAGKQVKVPRLVRMHSNEMEDIQEAGAGDICAMFGVDCHSGATFIAHGSPPVSMTSMFVPEPVISLAITTKSKQHTSQFSKALNRFTKEDPTFRVRFDAETSQTVISGMGELHLEYLERMRREFGVDVEAGEPMVAFRETVGGRSTYDYTHKKQSGGAGQFARVAGLIESLQASTGENRFPTEFSDETVGGSVPPEYIAACQKGFDDALIKGPIIGAPVVGVRMVINDGASHSVDSSEMAFRFCSTQAFKQGFMKAKPTVLEPEMRAEIVAPTEFQGNIISELNRRRATIVETTVGDSDGNDVVTVLVDVPLRAMFGFSTTLRSLSQGKGEFSMEFGRYAAVPRDFQEQLIKDKAEEKEKEKK